MSAAAAASALVLGLAAAAWIATAATSSPRQAHDVSTLGSARKRLLPATTPSPSMQAVAAAPAEGYLCNERLSVRRSWSDWNRTWELGVREQELCYSAYEGRQWYGDLS
eukprot:CAMPEP_0195145958 /NCGR_PEP_ID=MMETSP0448-20130528/170805_1 /TAXON_ID=66468 /ORGANISM="Heterocapsa triquestra, Strain CCMP 448" /LENGTH=108 /DNA_ID=CAMNT_0040184493 /DNA_START=26 /DNA_END=349 /DNA_ORIENTATION=-